MKHLFTASVLLAAGVACASSPYDAPYSIITIDEIRPADFHLKRVFVNRVDGENSVQHNKHVVAPGTHEVVIDLAPRGGFHLPTQQVMTLKTEPCVRYNLAARVENSISQKWEPLVRSTEPIGECQAKFRVARGD
jgi:hypothetical protein